MMDISERAMRLLADIGGINEYTLEDVEYAEIVDFVKTMRKKKVRTVSIIAAAAASVGTLITVLLIRPRVVANRQM